MECRVEFDYTAQEDDELSLKKGDVIMNVVQKMDGWWEGSLNGKTGMFPDNFVKVIERKPSIPAASPPAPIPVQKAAQQNNVILRSNSNKSSRRLKALFSYSPEQDDELRLDVGDVLEYIAEVEEGWWRGKLRGKVGIFPSNFVSDLDAASSNGKIEPEAKQNDLSKQSNAGSRAVPDVIPPAPPTSEPPAMDDDEDEPPPILPPKPVREQARCFYSYQAHNEDELTLNEGDIVNIISKNCDDEGWWRGEFKGKSGLFPDNFVRIISANEMSAGKPSTPMNSGVAQGPKISPQERTNLIGVKPINSGVVGLERSPSTGSDKKGVTDKGSITKTNGTNKDSIDGIGSSKAKQSEEGNDSVSKKVQRFSHMNLNPGMKPATPTSPISSTGGSFSLPATMNSSRDQGDDEEDFNSIERGENKLSHLTAGRAKAPRRRPPSAIIAKDGEENGINGSYNHDSIDSPTAMHSTPYNLSLNNSQNNTPSGSILDNSNISENGNGDLPSTGSAGKSKKVPPWMAELKQKQDKKALNSPNTSAGFNTTASPVGAISSPSSLSHASTPPTATHAMEKDFAPRTLPVKDLAPPLPAKPNTLATNSPSIDKSPIVSPSTHNSGGAPPAVANRLTGKKPPAPGHLNSINNSNPDVGAGGGDSKVYVSYDEYAKLRDRVIALEAELEAVRRQVKLLLDRELNHGHIV